MNIWDFILSIYNFFIEVMNFCFNLWNSSFTVGDYVISFQGILTTSLILVIGLVLVKKLVPVA